MEKLIELLNKFEKARIEKINSEGKLFVKLAFKPYTKEILTNKAYRDCWSEICSKSYGFIKWLVDNDKIDKSKVFSFIDTADKPYEDILCLLALSDEPIEDLISMLK